MKKYLNDSLTRYLVLILAIMGVFLACGLFFDAYGKELLESLGGDKWRQ